MKLKLITLISLTFLIACHAQSRIQINIPNAKSEAAYIWQTIRDTQFFEEHNYQVSLPQGALIEELKQKAKAGQLADIDYERLEKFVVDSVYQAGDYQSGYNKINQELALLNQMVTQLGKLNLNWQFKTFDVYQVNLTLYGPGGSFNPDEGSLLIFTTPTGQFKSYDNPANTIIHEIVHIGIEESIIGKYGVPHTLKERIVDTFVSLNFGADLPDYRLQDMGEYRTDSFLQTVADLRGLDKIVVEILQ